MKMVRMHRFILLFVGLTFFTTSMDAEFDGNYIFKLVSYSQAEIDNSIVNPVNGVMIFNSTDKKVYYYDGTQWISPSTLDISADTNNKIMTGSDGGIYYDTSAVISPKTDSYTLVAGDNGSVLTFDSAIDVTLSIPAGLPIGYNISVYQINTGKVTITGSGTTVLNRLSRFRTSGKDAGVGIVCTSTDTFHLTGDLRR